MNPASEEAIQHVASLDFRIWRTNVAVMNKPHTHPDVEVNFVLQGSIRYFLAGRFVEIQPGQIVLFWAGMPHQTLSKSGDVNGIWLTLPLIWLLRWKHTQRMAEHLLKGQIVHQAALLQTRNSIRNGSAISQAATWSCVTLSLVRSRAGSPVLRSP